MNASGSVFVQGCLPKHFPGELPGIHPRLHYIQERVRRQSDLAGVIQIFASCGRQFSRISTSNIGVLLYEILLKSGLRIVPGPEVPDFSENLFSPDFP